MEVEDEFFDVLVQAVWVVLVGLQVDQDVQDPVLLPGLSLHDVAQVFLFPKVVETLNLDQVVQVDQNRFFFIWVRAQNLVHVQNPVVFVVC